MTIKLLSQWADKSSFNKLTPQSEISHRTILLTKASMASSVSCKNATSSLIRVHLLDFSWWNSLPSTISIQSISFSIFLLETTQHFDNPLISFSDCDTYKIVVFVFDLCFVDLRNFLKAIILNQSMYISIFVYYNVPY